MLSDQDVMLIKNFIRLGLVQAVQDPNGLQAAETAVVLCRKLDAVAQMFQRGPQGMPQPPKADEAA